jgi:poly(A) polymerase
MKCYDLQPCSAIGEIKEVIKNAILDGEIRNDYAEAYALMERLAAERGLQKVCDVPAPEPAPASDAQPAPETHKEE